MAKRKLPIEHSEKITTGILSPLPSSLHEPHVKKLRSDIPPKDDSLIEYVRSVLEKSVSNSASCEDVLRIGTENLPSSTETLSTFLGDLLQCQFDKESRPVRMQSLIRLMNLVGDTSEEHASGLVLEAIEILPSLAFSFILKNVKEDGPVPGHVETGDLSDTCNSNSTDVLLLCLSLQSESSGFMPMTADVWFKYFCPLDSSTQTDVLKKLLLAVGERAKWVLGEDISKDHYIQGLKVILTNPKCAKAFAALLLDEVEQSRDKPGKFFQTTELGSLFSVSLLPKMNEKTLRLEGDHNTAKLFDAYKGNPHWPAPNPTQEDCPMVLMLSGMKEVQNVLKSAFGHLFQSEDEHLRDIALTWAATVLNKNAARCGTADPVLVGGKALCGDAYMQNFCSLILHCYESTGLFPQTFDLCCSSSPSCRLKVMCREYLAGRQARAKEDFDAEKNEHCRFASEFFHLCQQAISVSSLPAMHFTREIRQSFQSRNSRILTVEGNEYYVNQIFLLRVYAKAVWNHDHCMMIASFFKKQSNLLLSLLQSDGDRSSSALERQEEDFSQVPEIYVEDMLDWFCHTSENGLEYDTKICRPIIDFCLASLKRFELLRNPLLHVKLLTLVCAFVCHKKHREYALPKLRPAVRTLCIAFLRTYVDVSAFDGQHVDRDLFNCFLARKHISELFQLLWDRKEFQLAILSECSTTAFQNFLSAVLETMHFGIHVYLAASAISRRMTAELERGICMRLTARQQFQRLWTGDEIARDRENARRLVECSQLILCSLVDQRAIAACFTRPPLSYQTVSILTWVTSSLLGNCSHDCDNLLYFLSRFTEFILEVLGQGCGSDDGFVGSLVKSPRLKVDILRKLHSVLETAPSRGKSLIRLRDQLSKFTDDLTYLRLARRKQVENERKDWVRSGFLKRKVEEDLVSTYQDRLGKFRLTTASLLQSHSFRPIVQEASSTSDKMTTLEKELEELQASHAVHPDGSTFVVRDGERPDVLRCLLSGPAGTAYSGGVFVLDVYCPEGYPRVPPLVKLLNPGLDATFDIMRYRINSDISRILQGSEYERNGSRLAASNTHSIGELLTSLKLLLFERGSLFGCVGSSENKASVKSDRANRENDYTTQIMTVSNAMLLQLKCPPMGLEGLVQMHFFIQQNAILKRCFEWVSACKDEISNEVLVWNVVELRRELRALSTSCQRADGKDVRAKMSSVPDDFLP